MTFWKWSQTPASNATADSTINWAEGQAPSSVNDSARAMMTAAAKYRDDIAGAIATGGTSTAYTVTSYQVFDTLAHMSGQMIAFTPHATNTGTCTLNVDGLGAKPLRGAPSVELPSGSLILGTPYVATYNNSDAAWYLQGGVSNPYSIPLAGGIDYWGTTAPNSAFAFPVGQAISRTTYATLYTVLGTTFGTGDGSTTFNLPDKRGRVSAAVDNMGGVSAGVFTPAFATKLGEQNHTLTATEIPSHTHNGTTGQESANHTHTSQGAAQTNVTANSVTSPGGTLFAAATTQTSSTQSSAHTHSFTTDGGTGGGAAHNVTQPTIVCNYILRII